MPSKEQISIPEAVPVPRLWIYEYSTNAIRVADDLKCSMIRQEMYQLTLLKRLYLHIKMPNENSSRVQSWELPNRTCVLCVYLGYSQCSGPSPLRTWKSQKIAMNGPVMPTWSKPSPPWLLVMHSLTCPFFWSSLLHPYYGRYALGNTRLLYAFASKKAITIVDHLFWLDWRCCFGLLKAQLNVLVGRWWTGHEHCQVQYCTRKVDYNLTGCALTSLLPRCFVSLSSVLKKPA